MFVNFDKVFNKRNETEIKVPSAMINYLNTQLPEGIKYVADKDGCKVVSEKESFTIGGFLYKPTSEQKKILGKNYSYDDLLKYFYNAQKPIPLELKKDGYILLNGQEFPIDRLSYNPYNPIKYVSGTVFIHPHPFPSPFPLTVSGNGFSRKLIFKRVPNESVNIAVFESEKDQPLMVKYFLDETKHTLNVTFSFNLSYVKTIRDIVEATAIYNAFVDGKGEIAKQQIVSQSDTSKIKKYDEDSLMFWKKVLSIEEVLDLKFTPPENDIDFGTMCLVEELYQNLINNEPIKKNRKIESIDGKWDMKSEEDLKSSIDKTLFFEFEGQSKFSLFGQDFELPCLIAIFNSKLVKYSLKKEKYTLYLDNESENNKMYISILNFVKEDNLKAYRKDDSEQITLFHNAKTVQEYLKNN